MKVYFVFVFFLIILLSCSINNPFRFSDFDFAGPPEPIVSGVTESRSYGAVTITVQPVEGVTHRTFIDGIEYTQDSAYDVTGSHIFQALAKKNSNGLEVIKGINFNIEGAPQIQSIYPADGTFAVDETQDIILTFSADITTDSLGTVTLDGTTFVNGGNCTMSVTDNIVTIDPSPMLTLATKYQDIEISGFTSCFNRTMDPYKDTQYDFTTLYGLIRITNAAGSSVFPRMAYDGSRFGIIWQDDRSGAWKLYFNSLDSYGNKLVSDKELTDIIYTGLGGTTFTSHITWSGSEFGIAWVDDRDGNQEIYFNRLDLSGNAQISDLRVTSDTAISGRPWITWSETNSEYTIVWADDRGGNDDIYFARINEAGVKQGGDIKISTSGVNAAHPMIVSNSTGYGVSWQCSQDGDSDVYFTAINSAGTLLFPQLNISNTGHQSSCPVLTWTGTEYGLVWYNIITSIPDNITFARLNTVGVVQGTALQMNNTYNFFPYVVWNGTEYAVTYDKDVAHDYIFTRVNANSEKIGNELSFAGDGWNYHTIVWTGNEYALATDNGGEIYFVTITADGIIK